MKVLLVRIQNYENESLENKIKTFFEQKGEDFLIESFDLQNLEEIPSKLLALSNSVDYMIGIGLAGFFILAETNSNSKIVINPSMTPSELPDLLTEYQAPLQHLEEKTYSWVDAEMRVATYGIFTKESDEQDKAAFMKVYGRNIAGRNNYCKDFTELQDINLCIENGFSYFRYIKSTVNWGAIFDSINK